MQNRGVLIILSGFSGSGKGTIVQRLLSKYPSEYVISISATTRAPRQGEVDGREYFFKTPEEFAAMINDNALLEHARYVDHYYGTPRDYVEKQLERRKNVILEIEMQGALKVRQMYPDALLIFIMPPSAAELKARLERRNTESAAVIQERLACAAQEIKTCDFYDYIVINDDLETCVDEVHRLIGNEQYRMRNNRAFVEAMKQELNQLAKGEAV